MRSGDLAALELVLALERVERGVGHGEADLALAGTDQLEIVDRPAGDFRRRLIARQVLRQDVGEPAAERIVDAAGAAGADGDGLLLRERRARKHASAERERTGRQACASFVSTSASSLAVVARCADRRRRFDIVLAATARQSPDRTAPDAAHRRPESDSAIASSRLGNTSRSPASTHSTRSIGVFCRSAQFCAAAASAARPAAVFAVITTMSQTEPSWRDFHQQTRRPADRARTRTAPGRPATCISTPAGWSGTDRRR